MRSERPRSPRSSKALKPRIDDADHVARSICPYCAVGCAQLVYVKDGEVTQIEGDPRARSRAAASARRARLEDYVTSPLREYKVKYRRPYGTRGRSSRSTRRWT
jgi:formate dehydrogenase major subunit